MKDWICEERSGRGSGSSNEGVMGYSELEISVARTLCERIAPVGGCDGKEEEG